MHPTTTVHDASCDQVKGIGQSALDRRRTQAELQVAAARTGERQYALVQEQTAGLGLAALPEPSAGDLFFDMEGDPYVAEGGLEYLFGVARIADGAPHYKSWWAHDRTAEKIAFEAFVDFAMDRWQRDPNLHLYHYASYETEALKRLMGRHGTREDEIDPMLPGGLFVDLSQALPQAARTSPQAA